MCECFVDRRIRGGALLAVVLISQFEKFGRHQGIHQSGTLLKLTNECNH